MPVREAPIGAPPIPADQQVARVLPPGGTRVILEREDGKPFMEIGLRTNRRPQVVVINNLIFSFKSGGKAGPWHYGETFGIFLKAEPAIQPPPGLIKP